MQAKHTRGGCVNLAKTMESSSTMKAKSFSGIKFSDVASSNSFGKHNKLCTGTSSCSWDQSSQKLDVLCRLHCSWPFTTSMPSLRVSFLRAKAPSGSPPLAFPATIEAAMPGRRGLSIEEGCKPTHLVLVLLVVVSRSA